MNNRNQLEKKYLRNKNDYAIVCRVEHFLKDIPDYQKFKNMKKYERFFKNYHWYACQNNKKNVVNYLTKGHKLHEKVIAEKLVSKNLQKTFQERSEKFETYGDYQQKHYGDRVQSFTRNGNFMPDGKITNFTEKIKEISPNIISSGVISFSKDFSLKYDIKNNTDNLKKLIQKNWTNFCQDNNLNLENTKVLFSIHLNTEHPHVHFLFYDEKNTRTRFMLSNEKIFQMQLNMHHDITTTFQIQKDYQKDLHKNKYQIIFNAYRTRSNDQTKEQEQKIFYKKEQALTYQYQQKVYQKSRGSYRKTFIDNHDLLKEKRIVDNNINDQLIKIISRDEIFKDLNNDLELFRERE